MQCVQVSDPHTTNEDDSAVMRTLRRGDCCFIQGEGPEVPGKQPATPDPVHLAIVQDVRQTPHSLPLHHPKTPTVAFLVTPCSSASYA